MAELLKLVKSPGGEVPSAQADMIKALQDHLKLAESGELTGIILLGTGNGSVTRQAIGMNPYTQLAILSRTIHQVNKDWDRG